MIGRDFLGANAVRVTLLNGILSRTLQVSLEKYGTDLQLSAVKQSTHCVVTGIA